MPSRIGRCISQEELKGLHGVALHIARDLATPDYYVAALSRRPVDRYIHDLGLKKIPHLRGFGGTVLSTLLYESG